MNGKVAAVLGDGPGLGAAVARRFARGGFDVALMARREESVAPVRAEIEAGGGKALPVPTDATDSVAAAFERVRGELGDPEVFVYNVGAFQMGGIMELSPAQFDDCFKANCAGAFLYPLHPTIRAVRNGRLSARRVGRPLACPP